MSKDKKIQPKPKVVLTEAQKAQAFSEEYASLCEKHGYRVVSTPVFMRRDDNTFSIIVQRSVGKIPQTNS